MIPHVYCSKIAKTRIQNYDISTNLHATSNMQTYNCLWEERGNNERYSQKWERVRVQKNRNNQKVAVFYQMEDPDQHGLYE